MKSSMLRILYCDLVNGVNKVLRYLAVSQVVVAMLDTIGVTVSYFNPSPIFNLCTFTVP